MKDTVLHHDIENLIIHKQYFDHFCGKSILVTGATGLLGSILIKSLLSFGQIKVYACCRSQKKFNDTFINYKSENLIPIFSDIMELDISKITCDYIVHGASITDSKTFIEKPVETIDIAIQGTKNLLNQCINKNLQGLVYLSSLEIYGTFNNCSEIVNVKENDSGYIDTMSVRSSYSESKRMVETICKSYYSEYGIPIKVVRLSQTFGAGVDYNDNRVFAQFARAIIEHKDIILKTKGDTTRNYCYTTDAIAGILTVLQKGINGEAYNIANMETTISIADMANLYCNLFPDSGSKVIYDIVNNPESLGYNPVIKLQLDSSKLKNLGWKCSFSLEEMIRRLIMGLSN